MVYYNRFLKRWIFDAIDYLIIGWLIGWMVGHQLQRRYGSITSTATTTTPGMIVGSTTFGQQQQYHADILTLPWEEDKLTSNIDEGEVAKEGKEDGEDDFTSQSTTATWTSKTTPTTTKPKTTAALFVPPKSKMQALLRNANLQSYNYDKKYRNPNRKNHYVIDEERHLRQQRDYNDYTKKMMKKKNSNKKDNKGTLRTTRRWVGKEM